LVGGGASAGSGGTPLGAGGASGIGPDPVGSVLAAEDAVQSELAAQRAMGGGGFLPFTGRTANGERDRPHRNRLPNLNNRFFTPDDRPTVPVIGEDTEQEYDDGR
jgi:hypothetical protein